MDTTETVLLVGLGALAVGVAVGWHMRLGARKTRAAGAEPTASSAGALIAPSSNRFHMPVKSSTSSAAGCGCS